MFQPGKFGVDTPDGADEQQSLTLDDADAHGRPDACRAIRFDLYVDPIGGASSNEVDVDGRGPCPVHRRTGGAHGDGREVATLRPPDLPVR